MNLGRELGVDFSNKIDFYLSYNGLKDRILSCNDPNRLWFHDERYVCKADKFEYQLAESPDYIKVNYKDVIFDVGNELSYYFSRFELDRSVSDSIIDKFLKYRT